MEFPCQCGEYETDIDGCCEGCGYLEIECMCAPVFGKCGWFALCANVATMTRPHSILGNVPICERCNDKMERISGKAAK
jgi:hypothetical protein